jgi:hypothetical protein
VHDRALVGLVDVEVGHQVGSGMTAGFVVHEGTNPVQALHREVRQHELRVIEEDPARALPVTVVDQIPVPTGEFVQFQAVGQVHAARSSGRSCPCRAARQGHNRMAWTYGDFSAGAFSLDGEL